MGKHPEAKGLLILAGSGAVALALLSFVHGSPTNNWLGHFGYWIALSLNYVFGLASYLIVSFAVWAGWRLLCSEKIPFLKPRILYFSLLLFATSLLLNVIADTNHLENPLLKARIFTEKIEIKTPYPISYTRYNLGGVPTYFLYRDLPLLNLHHILGTVGICVTFSMVWLLAFILLFEVRVLLLFKKWKERSLAFFSFMARIASNFKDHPFLKKETKENAAPVIDLAPLPAPTVFLTPPEPRIDPAPPKPEPLRRETVLKNLVEASKPEPSVSIAMKKEEPVKLPPPPRKIRGEYQLPPLSLLTNAKKVDKPSLKRDLRKQAEVLEETLSSFGIEAKVGQINCGPTITSFEVHPAIGVKVQRIKVLENDIALNLEAKSIRIIAPIPGKAAVGVEIPSLYPQEVGLKEMIARYQQHRKFEIPVLLGKTVSGDDVLCDLTKMPHCIIAGATGSGKSVCINALVMAILMNARPDEVKLLLIDPKKVELSSYTNLPHMIAPVITEPHGAYAALNWLVKEMQYRYEIFKRLGVRNIKAFNSRTIDALFEESLGIPVPEKFPFFVAIIDEFADLMMTSSTDLETPVARIAQMARAVGIHLILATQRPSREVITGLIKANFPTRIAFKVSSRINSQIILDENGAEALLGNGDLLFMPPGTSSLLRAQGAYVSDEDINRVIAHCCSQASTDYLIKSFDTLPKEDPLLSPSGESSKDDLFNKALQIVIETKNASTTFLQRKLKIGYARAASLMDELEERGVIGPQDGSRARKVLLSSMDLDEEF